MQHQQIMSIVTAFGQMQDLLSQLIVKWGVRDKNLEKLGVKEMMQNMTDAKSGMVSSVEEFDAQPIGGEASESRKKN